MAIVSANRVWSGESWDDDIEGSRGYTEFWRIISNDPEESELTIRAALPLPSTAHYLDAAAHVKSRSAVRVAESRLIWECTVEYEFDPKEPEEPTESPLDEPTKFRWTSSLYTKPVIKDLDDEAVVNSAGDYFDPPPEIEKPRWQVNVQKNVASVPVAVLSWAGKVNDDTFEVDGVTVDAECARVIAIDIGEYQEKDDIGFRVFTYTLEFQAEGFALELLDQGYRIKDGTELKDILIEDDETPPGKNRPSAPVLLDGSGDILSDPSPSTAVFLSFDVYETMDFTDLPGIS